MHSTDEWIYEQNSGGLQNSVIIVGRTYKWYTNSDATEIVIALEWITIRGYKSTKQVYLVSLKTLVYDRALKRVGYSKVIHFPLIPLCPVICAMDSGSYI